MIAFEIGIDEAGRGPLAGPVAVGVALVPHDFDWSLIPGVGDSKQVSEKKREVIFVRAKELQKAGELDFAVVLTPAAEIDKIGIVPAVNLAMSKGLKVIQERSSACLGEKCRRLEFNDFLVKLDGGLKAPIEYLYQETIIKGDAKEKVIGLASIVAKVTRDDYMRRRAKLAAYAPYDFARHKGYGTKVHREAIAEHGLSKEHRVTFCRNYRKENIR